MSMCVRKQISFNNNARKKLFYEDQHQKLQLANIQIGS